MLLMKGIMLVVMLVLVYVCCVLFMFCLLYWCSMCGCCFVGIVVSVFGIVRLSVWVLRLLLSMSRCGGLLWFVMCLVGVGSVVIDVCMGLFI